MHATLALKTVWTTAFQDSLPDASFMYIEPGGSKDSTGRTVPRSLRHFPYKDEDGTPDPVHIRNALARIPQSKLPDDVKNSVARRAQRIAAANGIETEESAKAVMATLARTASDEENVYEGSYEDLIDDLRALLNPATPWNGDGYTCIVCTFPEHLIACRYEADGDPQYWHVLYSIDQLGDPRLGTATPVMQTYVPMKARAAIGPMTLDAGALGEHATALVRRTQGLHERRIKEGRVFSAANQRLLGETADTLEQATTDLRTLVDANQRTVDEAAKAAYANSPEARARVLKLLELSIH